MVSLSILLRISRPGLWLVFIWLYLWPGGGNYSLFNSWTFWIGLFYVTFPLNLLVYGMNDLVDEDVDMQNPRKGNLIYGAKTSRAQRSGLPLAIFVSNVLPLGLLSCLTQQSTYLFIWFCVAIFVNYLYNNKPFQLSRRCPFELPTMIVGHFLIPLFACQINALPYPSVGSWLFNGFLLSRSHIWLEYADIECDKKEGKRTIAVVLGPRRALILVLSLTFLESLVGFLVLKSYVLGSFSLFGMVVFYKSSGNKGVEKLSVSISQSLVGLLLMCYLWLNSVLV